VSALRPAAILGALLLAGCTTTTTTVVAPVTTFNQPVPRIVEVAPARVQSFTTVSGSRRIFARLISLNPDCSLIGYADISVTSPPTHGVVTTERGRFYPNFPPTNQRYDCNLKPQPGVAALYQSDQGYTGMDSVTLDILFPDGIDRRVAVAITVK